MGNSERAICSKIFNKWLVLFFLLIFVIRLPSSIETVIDWDEGNYWVVAQNIVKGELLYKTCWDPKGPILYFLFMPVIGLFGNSIFILRLFTTLYVLVSMFFIYLIARKLFTGKISLIPPLVYGLFFSDKKFDGLSSNGELFMMLPAIIAVFYFILYWQNKKHSYAALWLCGFFSGAAVFTKASAFFSVAIFLLILIFKKNKLKDIFWYIFGGLVICLIILSYFVIHNALPEFYHGFFGFNRAATVTISAFAGIKNCFLFLHNTIRHDHDLITILALGSLLWLAFKKGYSGRQKEITFFIVGLSIFSMIGVYWGRNMYSHHFLQMGLPFSLLIALGLSLIQIDKRDFDKIFYIAVIIIILATVPKNHLASFIADYKNRKNDIHYKVAEYIKVNTTEQDTIFVLGGMPIIYLLSERKAPTKYFHWLPHYGKWRQILQIRDSILLEFSKKSPKYIIYVDSGWFKEERIDHLEKFMLDNYYLEKTFGDYQLYRLK